MIGAVAGAWWVPSVHWAIVGLGLGLVVVWPRAVTVLVAAALVCGFVANRSLVALDPPVAGPFEQWVTLTSDPRPLGSHGIRARAKWGARYVSLSAHGPTAGHLDDHLAGDQVLIRGTVSPTRRGDDWARWRHEVGSISVAEVVDSAPGSLVSRFANGIRRRLSAGAEPLDRNDRSVFLGMVIGDDRDQSAVVADDFRAAGLGHLLVVSGQNVAFVLAIFAPALSRTRPGVRLVVLMVVLLFFALLTRFEPSVLRAVAMAAVGVGGTALGAPIDGRKGLSAAIAAVLVIDPFLVHVLAFQLSAAATAGIVWGSGPLAARLRGPGPLRVAIATTVSAQLAVAPLLLFTFGPMPLASLGANLLAGPVSGPLLVWGFTAGLVAGMFGGPVAALLQTPTELMLWWVRSVARLAAHGPQATIAATSMMVVAGSLAALMIGAGKVRLAAVAVISAVAVVSLHGAPVVPPGYTELADVGQLVKSNDQVVLILHDPAWPRDVVSSLRLVGVRRLDLVVATDGDAADAQAVLAIRERYGPVPAIAPPLHRVPGARTLRVGQVASIDGISAAAETRAGAWTATVRFGATTEDSQSASG